MTIVNQPVPDFKEFMGADAAADELKAMRLSKQLQFKNMRVPVRDGAHAAGRRSDTIKCSTKL
jgi:hypothetical protein